MLEIAAIPAPTGSGWSSSTPATGRLEIVCGAWNFAVGDLVPLAPVGAVLPGGFDIGRRKMRGVVSNGMLCSARELGPARRPATACWCCDVAGARPGRPAGRGPRHRARRGLRHHIEANRPDALCMAGVARDLAARLGEPFTLPVPAGPRARQSADGRPADLAEPGRSRTPTSAPGFTARMLTGVPVGPSPRWLARRLTLAGMRPINDVVDASNYVMLDLGQPTHPYDLDRLPGGGAAGPPGPAGRDARDPRRRHPDPRAPRAAASATPATTA